MHLKLRKLLVGGVTAGTIAAAPLPPPELHALETADGASNAEPNPALRRCAGDGDPACLAALGAIYQTGQGVDYDEEKSFGLMLEAANAGYLPAQRSVGVSYFLGRGVEEDDKKAADWLARAAAQGDDEAILLYFRLIEIDPADLGC